MNPEGNELNSWIYRTLAEAADWRSFDQLDQALAKETRDWKPEVRRSYLRGEIGRMLHSGSIVRDKLTAKYKISDEIKLF